MDFTVNFKTVGGPHIIGLTHDCGIEFIDRCVEDFNLKKLDYSKYIIEKSCPNWNNNSLSVDIKNRDVIKRIPQFKSRSFIEVKVKSGILGRYYKCKCREDYTEKFFGLKKELNYYYIYFEMDYDELIEDWITAGCPEYWDTDKKIEKKEKLNFVFCGKYNLNAKALNLYDALCLIERHFFSMTGDNKYNKQEYYNFMKSVKNVKMLKIKDNGEKSN